VKSKRLLWARGNEKYIHNFDNETLGKRPFERQTNVIAGS
jgi:hypothetical protein